MANSPEKVKLSELEDDKLIQLTLEGNTRAFDELVTRHSRKLHVMLMQILRSESDAYDIAQEAFVKAFRSLRYFNGTSSFFTWLYTIAANKARNLLRSRSRERRAYSLDDDENGAHHERNEELTATDVDSDPERKAHVNTLRQRLLKAIDKLSPAHKEVIQLSDIMGLPNAEIAAMLKISEGTLRSRIFYARRQLQSMLGDLL